MGIAYFYQFKYNNQNLFISKLNDFTINDISSECHSEEDVYSASKICEDSDNNIKLNDTDSEDQTIKSNLLP